MKLLVNKLNQIFWAIYRLTPRGKQAYLFKMATPGLKRSVNIKKATKMMVVSSAYKALKPKKLLGFFNGASASKSKKTDHEVLHQVSHTHKRDLAQSGLQITKKGKFKNA